MKKALMRPKMSWLCVCILLLALMEDSFATQTCAELRFKDFDSDTLYSKEGSNIRLVFNFTTDKCSQQPERVLFKVETEIRGYSVEFCKVTIDRGSCKVSDSSSSCRCLDSLNTIEFSKEVNRTDNRAFKWTWSDNLSQSQKERSIVFHVSYNKSDASLKTELSIVAPQMFVTDDSGTREFISTCRPLEGTRVIWDGVTCSHTNANDGSCTFTPRVADDGKLITCSAQDVVSGRVVSKASFTLQLSYPPLGPPMITGLKNDRHLFVGDSLTLTCTVLGGKPLVSFVNFTCGQRMGTRMQTNTSVSSILTFPSLTATDEETKCHCAASWQPEKQLYQKEATTELIILDNKFDWKLVIKEQESGEWVTSGNIRFKLKCDAVNLNPPPEIQWHGAECEEKGGDVCSFSPLPPWDDGKLITCSAYNVSHGLLASTSYTVKLKYPPLSLPEVHGLVEGQHLSVGQTLTANCTVKGGNPPVAAVKFTCGRHQDNNDSVNGDEVSSSVTFNPVTAEDNGAVCLCTAFWLPKKEFYVLKKSIVLTVSGAETAMSLGTMAAVTTVCVVIGIAVSALITYFVIKRKAARPYDHLNLKLKSENCYRDPETPRPTAPASTTDEETYEEVCDNPKVPDTAYEGIVSMRPHTGNRPTAPKNRSLFPSKKCRCKEDKPDGQAPVTKTTITKTFSKKDRSIKAPTTQSDEYLEPVLAAKEKEQTLERTSSSHCNYYSYPSIAYKNQHPSSSSSSSRSSKHSNSNN